MPSPPLLHARSVPYLVDEVNLAELRRYLDEARANVVEVDMAGATSVSDVIGAVRQALPFPEWCGLSWDSVEDAFEEIREAWRFPLVLILRGLPDLLRDRTHLGLETVIRFNSLEESFSLAGDQFVVVYAGTAWS
ncbi:hypothetical protein GTS_16910 [Gandjariella thermophila]|uniref:Barstar (barnase inhibitor) domain-containing protein n=1 Tax=Gandjariella thermophila TaxID=1931992 RepID=A0A4D4J5N9_9PSEU|nr:hypothetical protein GTS_16910 [Gandjariella thermophila]